MHRCNQWQQSTHWDHWDHWPMEIYDATTGLTLHIYRTTAKQIISPSPQTADADVLAMEVFTLLHQYHITNIFVTDNKQSPIGMVHIHDFVHYTIL